MCLNFLMFLGLLFTRIRSHKAVVFLRALEEALQISGATCWSIAVRRGSITVPATLQCATEKLRKANWLRRDASLADFQIVMCDYDITPEWISVSCRVTYMDTQFEPINASGEHHLSLFELANNKGDPICADEARRMLPRVTGDEVQLIDWYSGDCNVTKTSVLVALNPALVDAWHQFRQGFRSASLKWSFTTNRGTKLHLAL